MQIHSVEQKRKAIALAKKLGPTAAASKLGLPEGTVSCWCFKARKAERQGQVWPPIKTSPTRRRQKSDVEKGRGKRAAKEVTPKANPRAKKVARVYTPSEKARALELASKEGVTAASEKLGISRFSIYDWQRKVRRAAQGKGDSPTSGSEPAEVEAKRDIEILNVWREHPGLGPSQVRNQLRRDKGIKVSTHTVRRVMEDAGYRPPKVKRQEHTKRFEAVRPNHMWHLDYPATAVISSVCKE